MAADTDAAAEAAEPMIADINVDSVLEWAQVEGLDFLVGLAAAIAIFVIGRIAIRFVVSGMRRSMRRHAVEPTLESFICNIVRIVLLVVVILMALGTLGVQTTSFVAVLGAAGLAIGLALQGSLSNFAAGVLIVFFRPYKAGDYIEAAGVSGTVEEVQILTTILKTPDNKRVIVPNGQVMGDVITNYSANETRRVDLVFGVSYADDLDNVKRTLTELVAADDRILADPPCTIAVLELGDSSVKFACRPWVRTDDYWNVHFDLVEAVKKRFDDLGISIPFPQRHVHLVREKAD
ncbi:MAG TPA: mechanosensitive ion channel domain-containing protein [Woeseiaceae bacterium]|nr:mechanosensitive ion channel domain-containing protein [Woeseiaceae bacterium]